MCFHRAFLEPFLEPFVEPFPVPFRFGVWFHKDLQLCGQKLQKKKKSSFFFMILHRSCKSVWIHKQNRKGTGKGSTVSTHSCPKDNFYTKQAPSSRLYWKLSPVYAYGLHVWPISSLLDLEVEAAFDIMTCCLVQHDNHRKNIAYSHDRRKGTVKTRSIAYAARILVKTPISQARRNCN